MTLTVRQTFLASDDAAFMTGPELVVLRPTVWKNMVPWH